MSDFYDDKVFEVQVIEIDGTHIDDCRIKANSHLMGFECNDTASTISCNVEMTLYSSIDIKPGNHDILIGDHTFSGPLYKKREGAYSFKCTELEMIFRNKHKDDFLTEQGR
jgi:hypothetical protein